MFNKIKMPLVGALTAIISIALVVCGNPGNMGFCVACFLRDIGGSVGLHGFAGAQYARPEIMGLVLGAAIVALWRREFAPKGGSAPITRFILGACVIVGALIFLGCPTRMLLRIAGGDLNAIVALPGFAGGVLGGMFFLNKGFSLRRTYSIAKTDGAALPFLSFGLLVVLVFFPAILLFSEQGPGAMRAPVLMALAAGLVMGGIGFASRFCFVAGIRDSIFFKNFGMLSAIVTLVVVGVIGNIIVGQFNLGFEGQPVAHTDGLWNFLGMVLVGFGSVLLGGCPFRQVVIAGGGNADSTAAVFGMVFGGALAHNLGMASSGAGVTTNGQIGFFVASAIVLAIAVVNTFFNKKARESA